MRMSVYSATEELQNAYDINTKIAFFRGSRYLLTCDMTGLPEDSEEVSYRWFHSRTGDRQGRYQIQDGDPYYRVVKDTLLVDVTSGDQRGRYYCFVKLSNAPQSGSSTAMFTVEG